MTEQEMMERVVKCGEVLDICNEAHEDEAEAAVFCLEVAMSMLMAGGATRDDVVGMVEEMHDVMTEALSDVSIDAGQVH